MSILPRTSIGPATAPMALAGASPRPLNPLFFGASTDQISLSRPQLLFIFNPKSGKAQHRPVEADLRISLQRMNLRQSYEIVPIQQLDAALQQYGGSLKRVIALGGDGTASSVFATVAGINPAIELAVVPMGTGNLLAKNLGIPSNFNKALSVAVNGQTAPLDVASFNNRPFLVNAGAGIDASAIKSSHGSASKKQLGIFGYLVKGTQELLFNPQLREFEIEADGKKFKCKGLGVMVANTRDMLGPITVAPSARQDDQMLDVAVLGVSNIGSLIKGSLQALFQQAGKPGDRYGLINIKCKRVTVTWKEPLESQVDGEMTGPITRIDAEMRQQVPVVSRK